MTIAINIAPELMFASKPNKVDEYSCRIDSGAEDVNRTLTSIDLTSLNFSKITVAGFDKYLYFGSQAELNAFSAQVREAASNHADISAKPVDTTPYEVKKVGPDSIVAVMGQIGLAFASDQHEDVVLCNPIYQVQPDKKGNLIPVADIHQYVSDKWVEEGKQALFHVGETRVRGHRGHQANGFVASPAVLIASMFSLALVAVVVLIVMMFSPSKGITTANAAGMANAMPVDSLLTNNSTHPAAAAYGGGFDGQQGHGSVEDFSRLQVEQTEAMLKRMGVDLQASKNQDLGCFAKEES